MTLKGHYALSFKKCVFGAHHKNLNEDRPILSAAKIRSPVILVSDNIRLYADIRGGSPERGRQTRSSKTSMLSPFERHVFGILRNKADIVMHYYLDLRRRLSTDPKIHDLE